MTDTAFSPHAVELPRSPAKAETPFIILCSFLCAFVVARIVVAGLYAGWWRLGGFLYIAGLHIHHYNYGIALVSLAGFLGLIGVGQRRRWTVAGSYGVGLGLVFDEFAMWLRLEDDYYHRLSYDAVVVIAAMFLAVATFSAFRDRSQKHRETRVYAIPRGAILFHEGDPGEEAYYILEGRVRVLKNAVDGQQTLAIVGPGEFLGEVALFTESPRSATAEAIDDLRVRRLNRKNLLYRIDVCPELGTRLIRALAERLIATSDQLIALDRATASSVSPS